MGTTATRMPTAERRVQIRAVAARLFATRGFHGVSIEDIGAACGISGPAVYRHFPSKDALLSELLVTISEHLLAGAQHEEKGTADPDEALRRLIAFHLSFSLHHPELIRVQDRDLANLGEAGRHRVRRLQRSYVAVWAEVLRRREPALAEPEATARAQAVFGLLNSTPHLPGQPPAELGALLSRMAFEAATCRGPVPGSAHA